MKRVIVVLCVAVMSMIGVTSAQAATPKWTPAWAKPSAPTAAAVTVGATPDRATLTWAPPADKGSRAVYGYSIVREGGGKTFVFWQKASRDAAAGYTRSFTNLKAGTTYTFALKAWSLAGASPAATVRYTAPSTPTTPTGSVVYAVAGDGSVVSVAGTGGTPSTVAPASNGVVDLISDGTSAYWADPAAHAVRRVAPGGTVTTVADKLQGPSAIAVDAAKNVYIVDGRAVLKVTSAGVRSTLWTGAHDILDLAASPQGTVSVTTGDAFDGTGITVTTIAAGKATSKKLECGMYGYCTGTVRGDATGDLWMLIIASGASGYSEWYRIPAAGTEPTDNSDRTAYFGVGVDAAGVFRAAASSTFCPSISENTGQCTPDRAVAALLAYPTPGAPVTVVPASGATLLSAGSQLAGDKAGSLYLSAAEGLVRFAPTGGAATVVTTGTYSQVAVVG